MGLHIFWESKVIAISFGGPNWWSDLIWCSFGSDQVLFSSCVHLSTTNVEHLGSITSLEVIKAQSVRNEFICSCSFLARRLVSDPWFVSLMLDGEFLTFEVSCIVGMSSHPPPLEKESSSTHPIHRMDKDRRHWNLCSHLKYLEDQFHMHCH